MDDYVYTDKPDRLNAFRAFSSERFDAGIFAESHLSLIGCEVIQHDVFIMTISQEHPLQQLDQQLLIDAASESGDRAITLQRATVYRHVIGKMLNIGRISALLVLLHASLGTKKISDLHVHNLQALATTLTRLKQEGVTIRFLSSPQRTHNKQPPDFILDVISDDTMANKGYDKVREGYIIFQRAGNITHTIQWCARRPRCISQSSLAAETLSASDAVFSSLYIKSSSEL